MERCRLSSQEIKYMFCHTIKKNQPTIAGALLAASLLFTVAFAALKTGALNTEAEGWLRAKKQTAISCGSNSLGNNAYTNTNETHQQKNNNQQGDKDSGNGCSHQSVTGALCATGNFKCRLMKLATS